MARGKSTDGVFYRRAEDRRLVYYWRIGREKSKDFLSQVECAMEYIAKYVEKNPKYKEVCLDKTWDELFRIFGITIMG